MEREGGAISESDLAGFCLSDHVGIGQQKAVLREDNCRTGARSQRPIPSSPGDLQSGYPGCQFLRH
jgi:hypothetical protein